MQNPHQMVVLNAQGWGDVIKTVENSVRPTANPQKTLARDIARAKAKQAKTHLK